jgi:hypothetical protein
VKIERKPALTADSFLRHHLIARRPVIVTGETRTWPAMSRWTWDYFTQSFEDREVDVYDHWFVPTGVLTLGKFIGRSIGVDQPDPETSYVRWFARHKAGDGRWADDVFNAIRQDWHQPSFLPASGYVVPFAGHARTTTAVTDRFPYRALFMSAAGARTSMHMDPWMSSAVLCQVVGTKRLAMYAPDHHEEILRIVRDERERRDFNHIAPTFEDMLAPGEILFIPDGWWHHVTTLTDSISLTWNFVHSAAASRLLDYVRANADDPELDAISYLLADIATADTDPSDVTALVETAIAASKSDHGEP